MLPREQGCTATSRISIGFGYFDEIGTYVSVSVGADIFGESAVKNNINPNL